MVRYTVRGNTTTTPLRYVSGIQHGPSKLRTNLSTTRLFVAVEKVKSARRAYLWHKACYYKYMNGRNQARNSWWFKRVPGWGSQWKKPCRHSWVRYAWAERLAKTCRLMPRRSISSRLLIFIPGTYSIVTTRSDVRFQYTSGTCSLVRPSIEGTRVRVIEHKKVKVELTINSSIKPCTWWQ